MSDSFASSARSRLAGVDGADVWGFLAFSHGWTWLWWGLIVVAGWEAFSAPGVIFLVLGGIGPLLGALVMSAADGGREAVVGLLGRTVDPRRIPPRWWLVTFGFVPAVTVVAILVAVGLDWTIRPVDLTEARILLADPPALFVYAGFVLLLGPIPEEIGWRGYLLDRLQQWYSALTASVLVGVAWLVWHAPLFAMIGYFDAAGGPPRLFPFAAGIVIASIFYTWLYNNTGRSVLAAILFHFSQNFTGQFLDLAPETRTAQAILFVVLAVGVLGWWGPRHLRRTGERPRPSRTLS